MNDPVIRTIPLDRLERSPANVRRTEAGKAAFAELKASIAAHGLLENLVARSIAPGKDGGERYAVILRYDPGAPPSRPLDVIHDGKPAGKATRLDAYAHTAVKRGYPSGRIEPGDPTPEPPPSPLAMRKFKKGDE